MDTAWGGLIWALCVCFSYISCHIHVGHVPWRDALMSELYHNMGPIGRFKRAHGTDSHSLLFDKPNHWGRACCYACLGLCIEIGVVVLFLFFHRLYAICIGQLLALLLWAMALRSYAPRLLGKAFWFTLIFFIALTSSLLIGTVQSAVPDPSRLEPLVWGPASAKFNDTRLTLDTSLPLNFETSDFSPSPKLSHLPNELGCPRGQRGPEYPGSLHPGLCKLLWFRGRRAGGFGRDVEWHLSRLAAFRGRTLEHYRKMDRCCDSI